MARPRTTSDAAILGATGRAIGRLGVGRLTLAAVAEEAGLAPATLVQRFGSKRGLLLAFAARAGSAAREPFAKARAEHDSPVAALHQALAALASGVSTPEDLANSLTFLQLDLTDPEFRRHAADHAAAMLDEIRALLEAAVDAGEMADGTDTARLAHSVRVAYNGVLIVWALTGDGPLSHELRARVDDVLGPYLAR
jgi:AcrR family transcriptional regulator